MRLVTLDSREAGGRPGIFLPGGEILDLAVPPVGLGAAQWLPQSIVSILAEGDQGREQVARLIAEVTSASAGQREQWRATGRLLPGVGTRLLPPIRRPGLLLMLTRTKGPNPSTYVKNPNSAIGPDATVANPANDNGPLFMLPMVGLVIGRPLFRANQDQAAKAIAALTLVADLGATRLDGGPGDSRADARQFPGACVLGPALVTSDEFPVSSDWQVTLRVNARSVGDGASGLTASRAAEIVASVSGSYGLRPGDVVGVPAGPTEVELPGGSAVTLRLHDTLELAFTTAG